MTMTSEQEILNLAELLWGPRSVDQIAMKLAEEAGEVCGSVIKMAEGRETITDLAEEVGDVLFVASQLAAKLGTTTQALLASACVKNTAKLAPDGVIPPLSNENRPSEEPSRLQTLQTRPMSAHERRKANKKAQTHFNL